MAHRAFIGLALRNSVPAHAEEVFDNPAFLGFFVDDPETSEIPEVVSAAFTYEKDRIRRHSNNFRTPYSGEAGNTIP